MECKSQDNMVNCNCTYDCPKKGVCCECIAYHRTRGELPACYFSKGDEATYNRSIEFFISRNRQK
ncbi:MAG TPA: DUF6485 family protein [Caldisericia bacterium]|nr:DUF6485 family protein [Caldisericia bacterium]HPF48936.1 DUF6485 family protein [Caldisericia bacterium]HPI83200.1 DUF6485 family protein [Caldisericia bacterium]HPQ92427.1 DUF6485 family protein [Caldisericia bacterium]HRV74475.1 DUF6485 family protein [Caldisericia bacterium]